MELRSRVRPPARYMEYHIPELQRPPRFVHSTIPYNPRLPKAAFPTLDEPRLRRPRAKPAMGAPQTPRSALKKRETPRQAVIFRDPRNVSKDGAQRRNSFESEIDEGFQMNSSVIPLLEQRESLEDPGEFEAFGYLSADEGGEKPRAQLRVSVHL
jgi:hypothetical protein